MYVKEPQLDVPRNGRGMISVCRKGSRPDISAVPDSKRYVNRANRVSSNKKEKHYAHGESTDPTYI